MCLVWTDTFSYYYLLSAVLTNFISLGIILVWPANSGILPNPSTDSLMSSLAIDSERRAV